ncbi:unnamed protein product [Bursaphelenchus xylophilus]|nr:unnamed protein product [Bursaphelenchus xylophilus]CAG9130081.1 unnamed protein product [Bursaphelenchus xylophilus]
MFPFLIYPSLVKGQIELKEDETGMFEKPTFYWAKPPAKVYYKFNVFNVKNVDETLFRGEKVQVEEKGPYTFRQRDTKREIHFDKTNVNYKVSKQWVFEKDLSCKNCTEKDTVFLPNLSLAALRRLLFEHSDAPRFRQVLADMSALFLGIYPYSKVKVMDTLFWGYTDSMVDFLNSELKRDIERLIGGPILGFEAPEIDVLGYFPLYNNTDDGVYDAYTGSDEINNVGLLKKWVGSDSLEWWNSDYANNLDKTTDAVISGSFIKNDSLTMFQSFLCRHFELLSDGEGSVEGINVIKFKPDPQSYNPHKELYSGYQYKNDEDIDFFPDVCLKPDECEVEGCSDYCKRTNRTLPPGIHQHVCFPGRRRRVPFLAFDSLPHFLNSPKNVQKSIKGLNPDQKSHDIGMFHIQPTCGSTLKGQFRNQFNIAVINDQKITTLKHARTSIIPCFWLQLDITLEDYAYDFLRTNMVVVPNVVFCLGIISFVLGLLVPITVGFIQRHKRK